MQFPSGVVYTKQWVVDFMLDELGYTSNRDLTSMRILEPSCGCGAFVTTIVSRLCDSVENMGHSIESLYNCITAVDIDETSVCICRSNVSEVLSSHGVSKEDADLLVSSWINTSDFLMDSYEDFDFVVGNPPYVRSEDLPMDLRRTYMARFETVTMGTDLFVGFIENGLRSLSSNGRLCYICADRWMQNKYGGRLRGFITEYYQMNLICRMHGVDAFESDVSAYPAIIQVDSGVDDDCRYVVCKDDFGPDDVFALRSAMAGETISNNRFDYSRIKVGGTDPWLLTDPDKTRLLEDIRSRFPSIEDSGAKIGIGIATGRDEVFITTDGNLVESDRMLPLIKKEDIVNGCTPVDVVHWLVNPWDEEGELVDLSDFPLTRTYLESHKDSLSKRHVVKKDGSKWYRTIDKVNPSLRTKPKLLMQDMSKYPDPYYDDGLFYPSHNMYWITSDRWDLKVLGGILLSIQMESFIDAIGVKMRGKTMRCQAQYLRMLHVPHPEELTDSDVEGFRNAFDSRDRGMATSCMHRVLERV